MAFFAASATFAVKGQCDGLRLYRKEAEVAKLAEERQGCLMGRLPLLPEFEHHTKVLVRPTTNER